MATAANQNQPKILRIGVIQGGKIIEERLIRKREPVTIGQGPKNTIVIPGANIPVSFELFQLKGTSYALRFNDAMDGKLAVNDGQLDFAALKQQNVAAKDKDGYAVNLTDASKGKVTIGEVTLLFQFVSPPPPQPKAVLPDIAKGSLWQTMDRVFFSIMAGVLLFNFSSIKIISLREKPKEEELTLEELPDRFVKMIIPEKPVEPPKPKTEVAQNDKKDDKPKQDAKKDDAPKDIPAKGTPERQKAVAQAVASKGLLKILGAAGDGGGALEDVLGSGSASTDIASALNGAGGVGVASADSLAGAGRKGGGAGTAAGIGDLATSGGAGSGGTLEEKKVVQVTGRVIDQGPEIESTNCDRAAISRYVKGRIRAIQGCYEKELKRNTGLKGKVVVRFTIAESGRVSEVEIDENTIGNDAVVNCIKATVRSWVFPIKDNECPVAYPFVFSPAG